MPPQIYWGPHGVVADVVAVANRQCQCVGRVVRAWCFRQPQEKTNHCLDLAFLRATVSHDSALHFERRVFENPELMLGGNEQDNTPRLAQFERCLDVSRMEYSFYGQRVHVLAVEDSIELRVDLEQPRGEWSAGTGSYDAEEKRRVLGAICFYDAIAG
jgi:hypothetical protein